MWTKTITCHFYCVQGTTMSGYKSDSLYDTDLLTRTSWVDARVAYLQIEKGKATGNKNALLIRTYLHRYLYNLGRFIHRHCGKVLFIGLLLLSLCCVGLKSVKIETKVEKLWVEDGGRLQQEQQYTRSVLGEGSGTTSEILIQTPTGGRSILTQESLLLHHRMVLAATKIQVQMFARTWKFKDLCYKPAFPNFEDSRIDMMLDDLIPCVIITPLDCFWEGSKLLGPEYGLLIPGYSSKVLWSNLNPKRMVEALKNLSFVFPASAFDEALDRAGVSSAYQEKPCLDPYDRECPETAPNAKSKQLPNIGAEITGGCEGFATRYMRWHEDLIIGGVEKNRSGHIVKAEAMQSIIQLMGERDMFLYYKDTFKVHNLDWTQDKAKLILEAWQRQFSKLTNQQAGNSSSPGNVYTFSTTSLLDLMESFSELGVPRLVLGYVLMLLYACMSMLSLGNCVQSQGGIGLAGVLLVMLSVSAGLGLCSVLAISFNAATTQIIPFLALGQGVNDMFLIASSVAAHSQKKDISIEEMTGEVLRMTGVSIMLKSACNATAFFLAAIIPIPALRAFSLQAAILILFNMGAILLIYPAIISLDLYRRHCNRVDVFCCIQVPSDTVIELRPNAFHHMSHNSPYRPNGHHSHVTSSSSSSSSSTPPPRPPPPVASTTASQNTRPHMPPPPPPSTVTVQCESPPPPYSLHETVARQADGERTPVTELADDGLPTVSRSTSQSSIPCSASLASSSQYLTGREPFSCKDQFVKTQQECCRWSITLFAREIYSPLLQKTPVKVLVIVSTILSLTIALWGTCQVEDGLYLTDIVPRHTNEYSFLQTQTKYFGFYNFYAVTQGNIDYPNQQKLLYQYHLSFQSVSNIIKKEDGTLPDFWLILFRKWLLDLQKAFDSDVKRRAISSNGWEYNATADGILAYKLLVQTGDIDRPIDKDKVMTSRLVSDGDQIINSKAFYNYLSAWTSNDALAYDASQALIHPAPKQWFHVANDYELKIPKSQPIVYSQLGFYLTDMQDTNAVVNVVKQIRGICDEYTAAGLDNYPMGVPFTFWEQYLHLRFYLAMALISVLVCVFLVLSITLVSVWAAFVVVVVLAVIVIELFGFMGLVGIKLSAVPAVILIVSVGMGVEFTVHILLGFVTSIGCRNVRMSMALEHMLAPVLHGAISTLLGIVMLAFSEFDFIFRYFFGVLCALVLIGTLNGLVLLPTLLSILGPHGEVIPNDRADRISTPTPEPSPPPPPRGPRSTSRRVLPRRPSDLSLSTITEEPSQYSSHEIVVQPEFVVETTTTTMPSYNRAVCSNNMSPSQQVTPPTSRHVTTVKATTKVKVEVHTPCLPGAADYTSHNHRKCHRKYKEFSEPPAQTTNTTTNYSCTSGTSSSRCSSSNARYGDSDSSDSSSNSK